jgi:hypothetical protein
VRFAGRTSIFLAAVLLSGCSGGLGGLDAELLAQRRSVEANYSTADCAALTSALRTDISKLKAFEENEVREKQLASPTLFRAIQRVTGPEGAGDIALENFKKTSEHATALNGKLSQKKCETIDIERELRAAEVKDWQIINTEPFGPPVPSNFKP